MPNSGSNDPYALSSSSYGTCGHLAAPNIEIERLYKTIVSLDQLNSLSGKEEEVEAFILSFIRERVAQRITITKRHDIIDAGCKQSYYQFLNN